MSIAGSHLKLKSADELNIEESNKKYLKHMWEKYDKETSHKNFKQNVDADDNGGIEVKATIEGLMLSKYIPPVSKSKAGSDKIHFDKDLKEVIDKKEVNKYRLPGLLF
jgi:DNA polymerase I-like protein with 3'-5' exonuclease and polymerase domains